jgi:predicted Zn-dependent protease
MTVSKSVLRDIGAAVQARQPKHSGGVQIMVWRGCVKGGSVSSYRTQVLAVLALIVALATSASAEKKKKKPKNADIENIGVRNINKGSLNFISLEKEISMGREMATEVEKESKLIDDPAITEYVNRVAQNIVRNSDAKVPFTVKVLDSDEINAFALPGGFFFVNSGLLLAADDEAELAGVMAHEIAHVAARHGTEQASRGQLFQYASIPLIFVGGGVAYGLSQAANVLVPLSFLKFSRGMEEEADYLGVEYMYKTGYDPSAMVRFFEKLQAKEKAKPGTISKMFSTHPATGDRIQKVEDTIATVLPPADMYVETTSEFDIVKARLAGSQNQKADEDDNRPSLRRRSRPPDPDEDDNNAPSQDDDGHPTLKRRD